MNPFGIIFMFIVYLLFNSSELIAQTIFWSQPGTILKSKDLSTGEEKVIFKTDVFDASNNHIGKITLDTINQKIYFSLHINNPQPQRDLLMSVDYSGNNLIEIKDFFYSSSMEYHHGENKLYYMQNSGSTDQAGIRSLNLNTLADDL